jgi:hypothetical protein
MNDLLQLQSVLVSRMSADPQLCLAHAVVWLDPFWDAFAEEDDDDTGDGSLGLALRVVRESFPNIYVQVIELLRAGGSWDDIDRLVCREIEQLGIPLENLEWMGYGIPLPSYGLNLEDPDFPESHTDLIPVLQTFGWDVSPDDDVEVPDSLYCIAQWIAEDLEQHPETGYRQLSWLLQWLFSCSGNSVIDLDYETMSEFQPLSWDKDDLDFAIAIIQEADQIMKEALDGLAFLQSHPDLFTTLTNNVKRINRTIRLQTKEQDHVKPPVRCIW